MAAPDSTLWGNIQTDADDNHQSRIGIYTFSSLTASDCTITIQIWFWSKYSVIDNANTLYFDDGATSATTSKGSVSISTSNNSSWSTDNQIMIYSTPVTHTRGSSDVTRNCTAKLSNIEDVDNKDLTVSTSYVIPAIESKAFTIVYNANGGEGTMESTVVTYGETTNTRPCTFTRTGYTFKGWNAHRASDNMWRYTNGTDDTDAWYEEGTQPDSYSKFIYSNGGEVWKTSSVDGDTVTFYAVWEEIVPQSVYIYLESGKIYARAFIESNTSYCIDSTGTIYAPAFTLGSTFSFASDGVTATEFIEGTP